MTDACSASKTRGQVAYEAFKGATVGEDGFVIPWEMLPPSTQFGWEYAALRVIAASPGTDEKEVNHDQAE